MTKKKTFTVEFDTQGREVIRCFIQTEKGNLFTGKATCALHDEFALGTGMEIAEGRAELKRFNKMKRNRAKALDKAYEAFSKANKAYNDVSKKAYPLYRYA